MFDMIYFFSKTNTKNTNICRSLHK